MVLKSARCTVDMLTQILSDKTQNVGKKCGLYKLFLTYFLHHDLLILCPPSINHSWTWQKSMIKDELTGLYSKEVFEAVLIKEIAESEKKQYP